MKNVLFVQIHGQPVNIMAHKTDVWRIDILNKYGGVYIDTDAVFVNRPSEELRGYDAVGSYDWTDWHPPYPNLFFNGFMMGKPGAPFWKAFMVMLSIHCNILAYFRSWTVKCERKRALQTLYDKA